MGTTGYSTGNHVHIGVVDGAWSRAFYRSDFDSGRAKPLEKETLSFFHAQMFRWKGQLKKPYITHGFWEKRASGYHYGIDVVTDRSYLGEIPDGLWTKDVTGVVTAVGDDRSTTNYGYGKYVIIQYNHQTADTYTVKKGDTLGSIASQFGTDYKTLAKLNAIDNPNLIFPGQVLNLNAQVKTHTVRSGETLGGIAKKYELTLKELAARNPSIKDLDLIYPGQKIQVG